MVSNRELESYGTSGRGDAGYRGEIHAILYNTTDEDFTINIGNKIGQFVVRPVVYAEFVDELGNEREANGFGSTGK